MVLQERDIAALDALARYFMMSAPQLRRACYPDDSTGRITRRRLLKMLQAGFVRKRSMFVVNPRDGSATPVYHLSDQGRSFLAGHFDEPRYRRRPIEPGQPQHLWHYLAVTETHLLLDAAIAQQQAVRLVRWVHEEEVINPDEPDKSKRRTLFTEVSESPKRVCVPDAGFVLELAGHRAVFYLEQDRDTFSHDRTAARKSPGYAGLLAQQGHKQHFPETNVDHFYVVVIAPTIRRRDRLRDAFAKKNDGQTAARIYRFGAFEELTPANFLTGLLFRCCHQDELVPLVKGAT